MKTKACYIHSLFNLIEAANLQQIKTICAFTSALMHKQADATESEDSAVHQDHTKAERFASQEQGGN